MSNDKENKTCVHFVFSPERDGEAMQMEREDEGCFSRVGRTTSTFEFTNGTTYLAAVVSSSCVTLSLTDTFCHITH